MKPQRDFHPVDNAAAGIFKTISGVTVDLKAPTPDMINIEDIAASISKINRWIGHTKVPINVAQHSVLVSYLAPTQYKLVALLHDAAEAYTGDIHKPLKMLLGPVFDVIEERLELVICQRFKIDPKDIKAIKEFDLQAYELEKSAFRDGDMTSWDLMWDNKFSMNYAVWAPAYAEARFLQEYRRLIINSGRDFK